MSKVALSLLRGSDGQVLHVVDMALSGTPCFLAIPGVAGGNLLPLRRINSSVFDDDFEYECWNMCSLSHEKFVYIGEESCIELTKTSDDPLHTQLDIVLCFLMGGKINLKFPAWIV